MVLHDDQSKSTIGSPQTSVVGGCHFIPFALPFMEAFYADIAMIAIMACISAAFLAYSGKLIRREKFLP